MSEQEDKQVLQFRLLLLVTAIAGLAVPSIIMHAAGQNTNYGHMHMAASIAPLVMIASLSAQKKNRIKKWFFLILTWNSCYTAGFLFYGIINNALLHWTEYSEGFTIAMTVHFSVGALAIGLLWKFIK